MKTNVIKTISVIAGFIAFFSMWSPAVSQEATAVAPLFGGANMLVNPPQGADPQVQANLDIMRRVDQSWNDRDLATLGELHAQDGRFVFTVPEGVDLAGHLEEIERFFTAFPDHQIELPHLVLFGQGDMIVAVSRSSGTHLGPLTLPDGRVIPPTGKRMTLEMATIARVADGRFVEEQLFFDNMSVLQQLGAVEIAAEEPAPPATP